jgi:hypothetical protein
MEFFVIVLQHWYLVFLVIISYTQWQSNKFKIQNKFKEIEINDNK